MPPCNLLADVQTRLRRLVFLHDLNKGLCRHSDVAIFMLLVLQSAGAGRLRTQTTGLAISCATAFFRFHELWQ